jgi:uncharacterized membrane protein
MAQMIDPRYFGDLPPQLVTLIVAMLPIAELRGAVPLAMFGLGLSAPEAFGWSVLGNALVGVLVVLLLEPASALLRRLGPFDRFFDWLFERTRRKHSKSFERYESLALFIFVAIPLPMTGAWSGAVAAFVFGVDKRTAIPLIALGVVAAGILVTLVSAGALQLSGIL